MATMGVDLLFLDTNILVHASVADSSRHSECVAFLQLQEDAGTRMVINRQVLREFMAVLSRPQSFTPRIPMDKIVSLVTAFRQAWTVLDETEESDDQLLRLVSEIPCGGKQVHDANIVATMLAHNIPTLSTYNLADFRRFGQHIRLTTPGKPEQDNQW
ncbi:MAG: type II toxin-antitoxin system VapC family toxin [Magnetococcales bacterium]|nr:type II toxin-antitoxin system VapC family toxin [Magnetococcales bacterium]